MGTTDAPRSAQSQPLTQVATATSDGTGNATFVFPSPPQGTWWTGTLSCAAANTGGVFAATVGSSGAGQSGGGGTSWGSWGGNSVYGPVQCYAQQQLIVTAKSLAANTVYQLTWLGTSDPADAVAAIWPDSNSTALTAQISGTVPVSGTVSVGNTVSTNTNITGGTVSALAATTTISGAGQTGASTTLTVVSTTTFTSSGFLTVPGSGGGLVFSYTGTTPTSFTGVTLVVGTASWTITNGAAVVQNTGYANASNVSGTVTTSAGSQTNTSGLDIVVASLGFSSLPYTSANYTAAASYAAIQVFAAISGFTAVRSLAVINNTQGTQYIINRPDLGTGGGFYGSLTGSGSGYGFWVPLQANAGDLIQIRVNGSGAAGTGQLQIIGMKYPAVTSVTPSPNQSFDVVPYGGDNTSLISAVATGNTQILAAPSTGLAWRLHGFAGPYNAIVATGGTLRDAGGNTFGVISPNAPYCNLGGQICNSLLYVQNLGVAQAFTLTYDTVVAPNIL